MRPATAPLAFFLVFTAFVAFVSAGDWPTTMHDNQRTATTAESLKPPLKLAWEFSPAFPPAKGWSLPVNGYGARKNKPNVSFDDAPRIIAVGDMCYFCASAENRVYALDRTTGAVRWTFFTDAAPRLAPAYLDGALYVGADDGIFRCLDAQNGELRWQVRAAPRDELVLGQGRFSSCWPIRAAGIIEDGMVYFTAGLFPYQHIYFYAVDASNGTVRWGKQLDEGGRLNHVPQGYLLSTEDSLFTTSRAAPARWSKTDGARIDFDTPFPDVLKAHEYRFYNGGSYAQIWNGRNLVYGQACILAYDPDGELQDKWGRTRKGKLVFNWFNARRALFHDRTAYLATDDHMLAVPQTALAELAKSECREFEETYKRLRVASYLDVLDEHDELVRQYGEDDVRVCELEQGPLRWGSEDWNQWQTSKEAIFERFEQKCRWMTRIVAAESMCLAGDVIYAGGEDAVYAVDAHSGERLWEFPSGSRVRDLAVAGGRLYVSTVDGRVRCFERGDSSLLSGPSGAEHRQIMSSTQPGPARRAGPTGASIITDRLLDATDVRKGYCLIVGGTDVRLAIEIAERTALSIELVPSADTDVLNIQKDLAAAGLYGGRVCVRKASASNLPYPPYVFNLVIDQQYAPSGEPRFAAKELYRVTKPCGGVLLSKNRDRAATPSPEPGLRELQFFSEEEDAIDLADNLLKLTRGPIRGAADWTHNYANAANTYCSEDPHVRGPFGMLWYGEPGPRQRIDRHATPPMPLVSRGVLFTIGYDLVMAHDAYNGVQYWTREIDGVTREHLPINTSNLAADDRSLFVVLDNGQCLRLDALTGETLQTYTMPDSGSPQYATWAWIAQDGDLLYGSRSEADEQRRRPAEQTSEAVFALDKASGEAVWTFEGRGIDHDGIAVGDDTLLLVDRNLTDAQRNEARAEAEADTSSVDDRKSIDRRGQPVPPDLRKLVALDAATGETRWEKPLDVTDITLDDVVVQGRGGVACMVKDGVVVVHGTGSLGHPHKEFLQGEFARRALYAFDLSTGNRLWGGRRGYRKRPIIVGNFVYAEPFAWDLRTGSQKTISNPLSGQSQPLDFHRGYIGCGHILASAHTLFGAKGGIGYCNLDDPYGFSPFGGVALACGLGAVPAGGVFVAPEGRSGCTCDVPIHTSLALYPKPDAVDWSVGFTGGLATVASLPVQTVSINLGAPGYRKDGEGNLWIPYPTRVESGIVGDWLPTYQHNDQMCYRLNELTTSVGGTDIPWVYSSGYNDSKALRFRLIDEGQPPARYTIRLHFAEPEQLTAGQRAFSVFVQGEKVLEDFDVVNAAGGVRRAIVREFTGITVADELEIQLLPSEGSEVKQPVLSGFQAIREGQSK